MPISRKSIGLFAVLALTACTQPETQAPALVASPAPPPTAQPAPPSESAKPEPAADECGASKLGSYLGQPSAADTMARIKQTIGHDRIRTINPGDAVTMDFRPDRLNVEVGEDGRIKRLRCG